jgi:tRNA nucleotidyltransferase (CCA-adding enzyme)
MDLILTHTNTDLDGLGAMVAAKRLYPRAQAAYAPQLNRNVKRFIRLHAESFGLRPLAEIDLSTISRLILVDTQDPGRVGIKLPEGLETVIWDHHPPFVPPAAGEVRPIGAATSLLVHALMREGVTLTPPEATAMLLGIYADTGQLTFPSTTPEDLEAAAFLLRQGGQLDTVGEFLETALSTRQQTLFKALLDHAERHALAGSHALLAGLDWDDDAPELSTLTAKLIDLTGADVTAIAVSTPDGEGRRVQFLARSGLSGLDVRDLLAPWNPKGHPSAASAYAENLCMDEVLPILRQRLQALVRHEPTAKQLMSHPVRSLGFDVSVKEAAEQLSRFGHSALPVLHRGKPQGVISRRDLDRAMAHGRGEASIQGMVARRVEAVAPETPLSEIQARMVSKDIGRLLVIDAGELVGIVTRSDVLRALYDMEGPSNPHPLSGNLASRLRAAWPPDWADLLDTVGALAGEARTYLVGGAVRDLLLGRANLDVDLVVEGDAIAMARAFAERTSGALKTHEAFGTAHVELPDGKRIEFATARIEHYPVAGGLPVIQAATLKQDLSRRDFTVNALAMQVGGPEHGQLIDFFGGLDDLANGRLTILHPLSFIEDPTRILRAARFEQQLPGFRMDPQTEAFARHALASSRFDGLSSARVKGELRRGFAHPPARPFAERLEELDAWRMLDPRLHLKRREIVAIARIDRTPLPESTRWLLLLGIILRPLEPARQERVLEAMHLSRQETQGLRACWEIDTVPLGDWLAMEADALARLLEDKPDLAISYLLVTLRTVPARRRIADYRSHLRGLALERVDGNWLKGKGLPPGPRYAAILRELLDLKRAGRLPDAASEEREAEALIARYNEGSSL